MPSHTWGEWFVTYLIKIKRKKFSHCRMHFKKHFALPVNTRCTVGCASKSTHIAHLIFSTSVNCSIPVIFKRQGLEYPCNLSSCQDKIVRGLESHSLKSVGQPHGTYPILTLAINPISITHQVLLVVHQTDFHHLQTTVDLGPTPVKANKIGIHHSFKLVADGFLYNWHYKDNHRQILVTSQYM